MDRGWTGSSERGVHGQAARGSQGSARPGGPGVTVARGPCPAGGPRGSLQCPPASRRVPARWLHTGVSQRVSPRGVPSRDRAGHSPAAGSAGLSPGVPSPGDPRGVPSRDRAGHSPAAGSAGLSPGVPSPGDPRLSPQAVMGVQVVVTLLAASLMHRMAPHCSFARWLLCNGSLYRYKHPSDEELCALAGKQRPKSRRDRRASGVAEDKPLSVPRDIELQLDTSPITAVDALVLRYFPEYQWFVDFSVYAGAVYVFSEGYFSLASAGRETNLGVLWSLLTVLFSVKVFFTVMRHYFRSEEGGERSVCLSAAFFFLLLAMLALVVREEYLEFGLEAGLAGVSSNLEPILKPRGWEWTVLLHVGFVAPVLVVLLWVRPLSRDFLLQAPLGKETVQILSDSSFDTLRLWAVVALSLLRLLGTRHHLQAYLGLAERWVRRMRRQAGRIPAREIQQQITRIYCYVSVVSLQYLGPVILTLHCALLLKTLGHHSWGLYPESPAVSPAAPVALPRPEGDGDVQVVVQEISGVLGCIFTPPFFRGLFSFLTWWVAACQVVTSLFGLYFHQYLAAS
ncbi:transmembrane protein 161A isoform X2 [Pyrgilauda ruficollis]|uniref:transmembrane protein 161A isoform X2 n=1 Tax=Pyrgilauda ruficollis TaxID=221976 RepID=UPI001B881C3A|nr:transmembrane protein 161A isoform X2 [Pyrgilauda ruficollis]